MIRLATAAAILAFAGSAHAAVTFTSTPYDAGTPAGESMIDNFSDPIAAGYTLSGGTLETGSHYNAATPAGDTTQYLAAIGPSDTATLTSAKLLNALSVYVGSLDSYNFITFSGPSGFSETLTGSQLTPATLTNPTGTPTGDQFSGDTNRLFTFDFAADPINEVQFGSNGVSLEFDNISAKAISAAPEPASWALMIVGVGLIGGALRFGARRQAVAMA